MLSRRDPGHGQTGERNFASLMWDYPFTHGKFNVPAFEKGPMRPLSGAEGKKYTQPRPDQDDWDGTDASIQKEARAYTQIQSHMCIHATGGGADVRDSL